MNLISSIGLSLSLIFFVSSIAKIANIKDFVYGVVEFKIFSRKLLKIFGYMLPFIELGTSILLVFNETFILGAVISLMLLLSFFIAVTYAIKTQLNITCECFGKFLDSEVDRFTQIKIVFLLFANLLCITFSPLFDNRFSMMTILFSVTFFLIYMFVQKIWDIYRKNIKSLTN